MKRCILKPADLHLALLVMRWMWIFTLCGRPRLALQALKDGLMLFWWAILFSIRG